MSEEINPPVNKVRMQIERFLPILLFMVICFRMVVISDEVEKFGQWDTLVRYASWLIVLIYMALNEGRYRKQ